MPANAVLSPASRLREREKQRFHEDRKGRIPVMDAETLRELCLDNDGYETPELNDNLYAHFQGFQRIEGLEPYVNLKALWLESNGLTKIENIPMLASLRCLYLSKNLIEHVENLEGLRELNTLDLSDNRIARLAGLAHLPQLSSLNLSRNLLTTSEDLQELAHCAQLTNVDISHNRLEDPGVLTVLKQLPQLRALRITGNAVVSTTKYFRKVYISSLPQLAFLDRPVFPMERAAVAAWQQGGNDAELAAKRAFVHKEQDERKRTLQEFRNWQAQVREKRIKELDEERARKEQQQSCGGNENASTNARPDHDHTDVSSVAAALDAIDLKGFRGITKEQYARLSDEERAKWDKRIERAHADATAERHQVLGDGVCKLGASFWATEAERSRPAAAVEQNKPHALTADDCSAVGGSSTVDDGITVDATPVSMTQHALGDGAQEEPTQTSDDSVSDCAAGATPSALGPESLSFKELPSPPCEVTPTRYRLSGVATSGPPAATTSPCATKVVTKPPSPYVLPPAPLTVTRDSSQFFREVSDVRETWTQLEQRARKAAFVHRPQQLPSVHSLCGGDDDDDESSEDEHGKEQKERSCRGGESESMSAIRRVVASPSATPPRGVGVASSSSSLQYRAAAAAEPLRALTRDEILREICAASNSSSTMQGSAAAACSGLSLPSKLIGATALSSSSSSFCTDVASLD